MEKYKALARRYWPLLAAALAAFSIVVTVAVVDDDGDGRPDGVNVVIKIDGPDKDNARDDVVVLDKAAQIELNRAVTATDRPGDTHRELADPLREPDDPSRTPPGQLEGPLAAQEFPGCRTRFVANYSSRNGVAPRVIVWHQTVSRENGWSSQDALTALANRRSSGVSWNLLIGATSGRCTYSVPLSMKAWTQANANPFSVGIEVERYGDESTYVSGAGEAKLLAATREIGRRFNIPMRKGKVVNCRVVTSGIVEHSDLGACGGGHADVTPWSTAPLLAKLRATEAGSVPARLQPASYRLAVLTPGERRAAECLLFERRVAHRNGGWDKVDPSHNRRAVACKRTLLLRNSELHRLGLTSTYARAARHRVIHEVV